MNSESTSYMTKDDTVRMLDFETQRQDTNTTAAEHVIGVETAISYGNVQHMVTVVS